MSRERGGVYIFQFGEDQGGPHRVVVVSRDTNRQNVLVAFITTTPQPSAPDVVPIDASWNCHPTVKGFVRCDNLILIAKNSARWAKFVLTLSDSDMAKVEAGLRAALQL